MKRFQASLLLAFSFFVFAAAPARAADDAKLLELSGQVLEAMHANALVGQMLDQMMGALGKQLGEANPGKAEEIKTVMSEVVVPEFQKRLPEMNAAMARVYAQNFTEEELKGVLAFYRSKLGQKLIEKNPEIARQSFEVGQAWAKRVMPDIIEKLTETARQRGLQLQKKT